MRPSFFASGAFRGIDQGRVECPLAQPRTRPYRRPGRPAAPPRHELAGLSDEPAHRVACLPSRASGHLSPVMLAPVTDATGRATSTRPTCRRQGARRTRAHVLSREDAARQRRQARAGGFRARRRRRYRDRRWQLGCCSALWCGARLSSQLTTFEAAIGTQRLLVCGDNDAHGTGQRAAYTFASRSATRLPLEVRIPREADTNWNDVRRHAEPLPWRSPVATPRQFQTAAFPSTSRRW